MLEFFELFFGRLFSEHVDDIELVV